MGPLGCLLLFPAVIISLAGLGAPEQSPRVDHSLLNDVVQQYVDNAGWVNYRALKNNPRNLHRYIAQLRTVPFDRLGRDEKLALLINAYNAFTLKLIIENYPLRSIKDIPERRRFKHLRWRIGDHVWSLDQIEHQQIRARFREPRIHFALVCAAVGCPPLRNEAYVASRLDKQLEDQARYVHQHRSWFYFDPNNNRVFLTKLYSWFAGDFRQSGGTELNYAARYSDGLQRALRAGRRPTVYSLEYDWRLNDVSNRRPR